MQQIIKGVVCAGAWLVMSAGLASAIPQTKTHSGRHPGPPGSKVLYVSANS